MSFQWNYSTNIPNTNNITNSGAEQLLQDFNNALVDHKKKQNNLIQNFLSSNNKFDEVTSYFMQKMNPILKLASDKHEEENKMLREEISRLKSEISAYEKHIERERLEREEMALSIMNFCDSDISPTEFELFIGALFCALGYKIEHVGKTHDGGIDLIVRHFKNGKGVVQVKQYRKNTKVTEPQIRDLFGAMSAKQEVEYGIMVVLSDCTKEAKTWPQRENVTNLKIWTQKELISLLEEKGNDTLLQFIKILKEKHEKDIKKIKNININDAINKNKYITPKHSNSMNSYSDYSQQQQQQPSNRHTNNNQTSHTSQRQRSTLSSAKKQKKRKLENLKQNWSNFKFSEINNKENMNESKLDNEEENIINNGETSPYSSNDSLLLSDEAQSEGNDSDKDKDIDFKRINNIFHNDNNNNNNNNNNNQQMDELNTKLLWSLQNNNNNMNKPRRVRRTWRNCDDIILIDAIKSFGINWNETNQDQWNNIYKNCTFSHQFSVKDIKKHYARVLKPKILMNNNSNNSSHSNQCT